MVAATHAHTGDPWLLQTTVVIDNSYPWLLTLLRQGAFVFRLDLTANYIKERIVPAVAVVKFT